MRKQLNYQSETPMLSRMFRRSPSLDDQSQLAERFDQAGESRHHIGRFPSFYLNKTAQQRDEFDGWFQQFSSRQHVEQTEEEFDVYSQLESQHDPTEHLVASGERFQLEEVQPREDGQLNAHSRSRSRSRDRQPVGNRQVEDPSQRPGLQNRQGNGQVQTPKKRRRRQEHYAGGNMDVSRYKKRDGDTARNIGPNTNKKFYTIISSVFPQIREEITANLDSFWEETNGKSCQVTPMYCYLFLLFKLPTTKEKIKKMKDQLLKHYDKILLDSYNSSLELGVNEDNKKKKNQQSVQTKALIFINFVNHYFNGSNAKLDKEWFNKNAKKLFQETQGYLYEKEVQMLLRCQRNLQLEEKIVPREKKKVTLRY